MSRYRNPYSRDCILPHPESLSETSVRTFRHRLPHDGVVRKVFRIDCRGNPVYCNQSYKASGQHGASNNM